MLRGCHAWLLVVSLGVSLGLPLVDSLRAEEVPQATALASLLELLDSPRFIERRRAQGELEKLSLAELAPLRPLIKESPSAEVRAQLRFLFNSAEHRELSKAFEKLATGKGDNDLDLEEAMWLVTLLSDPDPSREEMKRELDALAELVRRRMPAEAARDPRRAMETLHAALYGERKFRINFPDYDNLANASALEVLRKNRGLPITLGVVTVLVAQRLKLPIVGIATPGRYLVKYQAKPNVPHSPDDIFLDPIEEGRVTTIDQVTEEFADTNRIGGEADTILAPASHRATLRRMLTNVISALRHLGEDRRVDRVELYLRLVGEERMLTPPKQK